MAVPQIHATAAASVTRPADTTAYASGDLLANSTTAGSVVPLTFRDCSRGPGLHTNIRRVRITKSGASITNSSFRLHLFTVLPTVSSGDNAAIVIATGSAAYVGQVDVTVSQAFTDGAAGQTACDIVALPASNGTNLFGLIEVRGAYTPISGEIVTASLELAQD